MNTKLNNETWIFVVVQNPGKNEQFFGLSDKTTDISYIPAFKTRDDAQSCLIHLPTKIKNKYEVQAIMYEDLTADAFQNGFSIFILDGEGKIMDKIPPDHP